MENVHPNTYHIRPQHLLITVPVNIVAELKAGDTLEPEDYPNARYALSEKDVKYFDLYDPRSMDDICLSLRRTSETDPYAITGLSVYRDY